MSKNPLIDQLRNFIFDELVYIADPNQFSNDDNLLEIGLDSMGIMRLIMFIEDQLNVTLPDSEIEPDNFHSLNALAKWILNHS